MATRNTRGRQQAARIDLQEIQRQSDEGPGHQRCQYLVAVGPVS